MSFRKYTQYKSSHVEWLGEIPAHWDVFRLKDVAEIINGYPFDSKNFEPSGDFPLLRIRDLNCTESAIRYSGEYVASAEVTSADILVGMDGDFEVGRWYGREPALLNQRMCCIRTSRPVLSTILEHALPAPLNAINDISYSTTVKHLSSYDVAKIRVALPKSDSELEALAAFLYAETSKIDALIAEQEKLLELLAEKRQATISHAVTRGLNPDVPMKDSGVEWLGGVPEHWEVGAIKHWFQTTSGGTPDTGRQDEYYTEDGGYPWIRTTDLNNAVLDVFEVAITDAAIRDSACALLPMGSVLVAMYGGDGTIGKNAILNFDACINQAVCALLPNLKFIEKFTFRYIQSYRPYWMIGAESSRKDPNISQGLIRNTPIVRPPLDEQLAIAVFLDTEIAKLDRLRAEAERAVTLLTERRSALISAAVTGKIDVREHPSALADAA